MSTKATGKELKGHPERVQVDYTAPAPNNQEEDNNMNDRAKITTGIIDRLNGLNEDQLRSVYVFSLQKDATDKRSEADKLRMGIIEQLYKTDSIRKLRLVSTFAAKEVCLKCKAAFAPGENCECEREPVSSEADALRAEIARFMETVGTSELRFVYGFLRA